MIASAQPGAQVNGYRADIQGIPVFHVWGTDFEMGYALGYLDGDRGKLGIEQIQIPIVGGPAGWEAARAVFNQYFAVPQRIEDMVTGMIAGVGDRPDGALYSELLGRNFDSLDIFVAHSLHDVTCLLGRGPEGGCTSLTAWDDATASDPELQGAPALVRNNDGSCAFAPLVAEVPAVIALDPDDGNQTVLLWAACDLYCYSGMNEHGISVTMNSGNYQYVEDFDPAFVPMGYAVTMGLLKDDFDGSETNDLEDLLQALTSWNRAFSSIYNTAAPRSLGYLGEPSVVVEVNNPAGYQFRYAADDPVLAPDHLAATNHHRLLYPPVGCSRYALLSDSLSANPHVDLARLWDLMGCCDLPINCTVQTMLLLPESRKVGIAYCDLEHESWEKDPVWFTWDELFPDPASVSGADVGGYTRLCLYPNPSPGTVTAAFTLPTAGRAELAIYDIGGRMVRRRPSQRYSAGNHLAEFGQLPVGVYLCRVIAGGATESRKVVVVGK
jgi:hypothetical protein